MLILFICLFLYSYSKSKTKDLINGFENEFHIDLPNNYKCIFKKSLSSIDSVNYYVVIKYEDDFKLEYKKQLYTDYANYESFNIFEKIDLAKQYFSNVINKNKEKYFVNGLDNYDWYGYEYKDTSYETVKVTRYIDFYVLQDLDNNLLYIFYDKHQYLYNNQR